MRRILVMTGVLLTMCASIAAATGGDIALNYNACESGPTYAPPATPLDNKSPTCTATSGKQVLVASFDKPAEAAAGVDAIVAIIDYQTQDGVANNCWWNFTNPMRTSALGITEKEADINGVYQMGCDCYMKTHGNSSSGGGMGIVPNGNGRMAMSAAVPTGSGTPPTNRENFAFEIDIQNGNQADPACQGCLKQACLTLNRMTFTITGNGSIDVYTPRSVNGNYITWQGGGSFGCQAVTPAKKATWGSVKALYR